MREMKNKIILGDFNCAMDKMDRDGENKTQRLYECCYRFMVLYSSLLCKLEFS